MELRNPKKYFSADVLEKLYADLRTAYDAAPEHHQKDSDIFDEITGKHKTKRVTYWYSGRHVTRALPVELSIREPLDAITFQAGSTSYTVYNTKAHIRILAQRLGLMLKPSEFTTMPVWADCSGYTKQTAKVKLIGQYGDYLPVYTSDKEEKKCKHYFVMFDGKLLYIGKEYVEPSVTYSKIVEVVQKFNKPEPPKLSKELFDHVKGMELKRA